ncbi:hypothetical protein T492DRAFT_861199 [Pavlovales sp. CCMP2436]|nr:hypothetical protein T492DRAFT_861199 [Pavlovales sp. CCMP2436]
MLSPLEIVRAALDAHGLVGHQLASYDDFTLRRLQLTVDMHGIVDVLLDMLNGNALGAHTSL